MLVEPDISPLAKRLAEENNVNWRGLLGSGAGGKIVERDVLEYLAKVMAGEEDINPTAEPLPEGLDAWPEDDVRSFYGGAVPAEAPSASEEDLHVDTPDLGSLELDTPAATHTSTTHAVQSSQESPDLGEDIFLIDEVEEAVTPVMTQSVMTPSAEQSFELEAEVVTFDEISSFDEVETEVLAAIGEDPSSDLFAADDDVENLAALFVDDAEDEGVIVAEVEQVSTADNAPELTYAASEEVTSFEAPADPDFDIPAYAAEAVPEETEILQEDEPEDEVVEAFAEEPAMPNVDAFESVSFEADAVAQSIPEDTFTTSEEPVAEMVEQVEPFDMPVESDVFADSDFSSAEVMPRETSVTDESTLRHEPEATFEPSFEPVVAPAVAATISDAGALGMTAMHSEPVQVETPVNLPLVSYGVLLRRHVDLSTLMQAQHAVAEEIGQEEPVAITSFLLRAAAKAQHRVSLVSGRSIGLAVIRNQGISVVAVNEASSAPFRQVLSHTQQALSSQATDKVDLVVADMSGFDIDEAVLNVGAPVLTLGRTMYDSSKGTHHSTLSLSGNISVESGTKFLSAVAELLNSPVRLVV
jgi:hypothetical protein